MRKLHSKCAFKQNEIRKKSCMHVKEVFFFCLHCAKSQIYLAVIQCGNS